MKTGEAEHTSRTRRDVDYDRFTETETNVRVTNIEVKSQIQAGDKVLVHVTVGNDGNYPRTVAVTLEDTTRNVIIGTKTVTLPPRNSRIVAFRWNTQGFSPGDHILRAETIPSQWQNKPRVSSWSVRREGSYGEQYDRPPLPISSQPANTALARANHMLRLANRELEDAVLAKAEAERYRQQAEREAARAFERCDEELHRTEIARETAEAARVDAERELETTEAIRARVSQQVQQMVAEAEHQAQDLKSEVDHQTEVIQAEVEVLKTTARQQLKEAQLIRAEAENYREQVLAKQGAEEMESTPEEAGKVNQGILTSWQWMITVAILIIAAVAISFGIKAFFL
ncbi:MAG: hypothetical protein J7K77_03225 [Dehalococcoidales bacterium]|nr:hypothetical protein [Dehalococcoidales bacterium]